MSSQRNFIRFIFSVVALVLLLHISFSLISASPTQAQAENTAQEDRIGELTRQLEDLRALVERQAHQDEHVLLLRIEEQTLGGALTLRSIILRVSVDQRFFDSCAKDDEITDSPWIESLTESMIGDFRIFVADKFTVSH